MIILNRTYIKMGMLNPNKEFKSRTIPGMINTIQAP
jgi:hypothetical protein